MTIDARCPCDICKRGRSRQLQLGGWMVRGEQGPPGDVARGEVGPKARGMYHKLARKLGARSWPIWWPFRPGRAL